MPRRSVAALATVTPITEHRPPAPDELTAEQKAEWEAVVGRMPNGWFGRSTHGLLAAYLRHWSTQRFLSKQIDAFNPEWFSEEGGFQRYSAWLALRARESKAMADLATKLRMSNQSRYTPQRAGTATRQEPFSYIDDKGNLKLAPWERYKNS